MTRFSLVAWVAILAMATTACFAATWTVDDDGAQCPGADFTHPQDAVNAAAGGDTIHVYPGYYGSRVFTTPVPPHWGPNDQYAPALIVYKNELTIQAVDPDPSTTVIEANHGWWSNPVAIQASTGGTWDGSKYVGAGVYPDFGTAPNAVSIIANDVTMDGFTIRRPYDAGAGGQDVVLIGGLYGGDDDHLGCIGNMVKHCVLGGGPQQSRNGVGVWHSSNNLIVNNTIIDPQWSAISIYDGYSDAEVGLGSPSTDNHVVGNKIIDDTSTWSLGQAVFVGAWNVLGPIPLWTDNSGTKVHGNDCGGMGLFTAYSLGPKRFSGNRNVGWCSEYEATDAKFPGNSNHGAPPGLEAAMNDMAAGPSAE